MKNIAFVAGAFLTFAGLIAAAALLVAIDSIKIQVALGNYQLAKQLVPLGVGGLIAMGAGLLIMKKTE